MCEKHIEQFLLQPNELLLSIQHHWAVQFAAKNEKNNFPTDRRWLFRAVLSPTDLPKHARCTLMFSARSHWSKRANSYANHPGTKHSYFPFTFACVLTWFDRTSNKPKIGYRLVALQFLHFIESIILLWSISVVRRNKRSLLFTFLNFRVSLLNVLLDFEIGRTRNS